MIHESSLHLRHASHASGWSGRAPRTAWRWSGAALWCLLVASTSFAQERVEPATSQPMIEADGGNRVETGVEAESTARPETAAPETAVPEAMVPDTAPRQAPSQPPTANNVVIDTLDLGTASITGMQELPRVLYIVPWKRAEPNDPAGRPVNSLLDEVLAPVDPTVFERHIRYYDALNGLSE